VQEVAAVAVKARVIALVAASDAFRRGTPPQSAGALAARVGSIAFQAEESVQRAAALIGECEELSASDEFPTKRTRERISSAITSLHEFAAVVEELHGAMKEQLERASDEDGDRPTLPGAPEALRSTRARRDGTVDD
jgi:hypothetical protein